MKIVCLDSEEKRTATVYACDPSGVECLVLERRFVNQPQQLQCCLLADNVNQQSFISVLVIIIIYNNHIIILMIIRIIMMTIHPISSSRLFIKMFVL